MDDQQEQDCASEDQETILINGVKENGKELNYGTWGSSDNLEANLFS